MMKKLSLAICLTLCSILLFAQQKITGKVLDAGTGRPVPGASVDIAGVASVITDEQGVFRATVPTGNYSVSISSIGYKALSMEAAAGDQTAEFRMESHRLFLQPVEIRAIRASDRSPFTKSNLSKKDVEKLNLGQDLPFLLNRTPSVVVNSDAGNGIGYTGLRIRGTDPTRINVTLNGIPYNDAESQGTFFVDLPDFSSSVNSIQIQRGVGTSSNGGAAFGATINIGTNEFNERAYAEFNNSYGSFNSRKHTIKAGSGLLGDHFTVDARLSKITSNGFIDRASSDLQSYYVSTAFINKRSSLRLNIFSGKEKTYQAWNGILQSELSKSRTYNSAGTEKPGDPYDNETDNFQQDHYQLFYNQQFSDVLSFNTALFLTRGKGYYEQYKADQPFEAYGLPDFSSGLDTIRETDLVRQLWLDNYFYGNIFSLQYKKNGSQLIFGGGVNRFDGRHYGRLVWGEVGIPKDHRYYSLDAVKKDANVYAKMQQSFAQHWTGFIDLQYRAVDYRINGFRDNPSLFVDNSYRFFNPKLGISYGNKNWNAYLSYAVGNKEPNRDDFEESISEQPSPETLHDFELGVAKSASNFSWQTTFFYMQYRNQLVLTGRLNDVGAYTRTNIPRSYRAGIEMQADARFSRWIYANGNLSLSKNKVKNFTEFVDDYDNGGQKQYRYSESDISFSPPVVASWTVGLQPLPRGSVELTGKYVGRQYLDNTANKARSLADYYVQDLRASYAISGRSFREIQFILQVNNLFDRMYEPNGYTFSYISENVLATENYVYPMAGINWMAGIGIKL